MADEQDAGGGKGQASSGQASPSEEKLSQESTPEESVVVVSFEQDGNAYEALTRLKELDSQHQIDLSAAAVVVRSEDGQVAVKDEVGDLGLAGTATGGVIGLLIGIIGGPLGILIGGATGLVIGSLFDLEDEDETKSMLSDISQSVRVGHTALLAEVSEPSAEVIDAAMDRLGGSVLRRPVYEVEAEIAAAEDAQRAAKRQARKLLHEQRHAKHKEKVHDKVEELKAKLHHRKDAVGASSS